MTLEDINSCLWTSFSIQLTPNDNSPVLVLICENEAKSDMLWRILKHNAFDLEVLLDNGERSMHFDFIDTEVAISYNIDVSIEEYPRLRHFLDGSLKHLSTGIWGNNAEVFYRNDLITIRNNRLN